MKLKTACILALLFTTLCCSPQLQRPKHDRRYQQKLGNVAVIVADSSAPLTEEMCASVHREQLSSPDSESTLYFIFAARAGSGRTALYFGLQVDEMSSRDYFLWYRSELGKVSSKGTCELVAHGSKVLSSWKNDDDGHSSPPRVLKVGELGLAARGRNAPFARA